MNIAIDASRIVNEKAGVGRYAKNLIENLLEIDRQNKYLLLLAFMRGAKEKEKILSGFRKPNVIIKTWRVPGKLKEMLWRAKFPLVERMISSADIYSALSFLDIIYNTRIPQVVIIHDLTTFRFPEHLGPKIARDFNQKTKLACQKAQKIIAISEATKKDIIEILKINPDKIEVIYPGATEFPIPAKNLPLNLKPKSYILAVGTVEPRKNLVGLFKAYALLPPNLQEKFPLVVAGAEGWNTGETYFALKGLNLDKKVKFSGFVSDAVLAKLYKETVVFVYPSLYEGFGFPILEAMQFGRPVITSNISSMPEVAGKAGILIDPNNPKQISQALQRVLEHQSEAKKIGEQGLAQAKKFTWNAAAKKTLKVFHSLKK